MINRLSISNFKCFEKIEIPFRALTLLTGVNSAGKSTTIQALLLLRQSWLVSFDSVELNGALVSLGGALDVLSEDADKDELHIQVDGENHMLRLAFSLPKEQPLFVIDEHPSIDLKEHFGLFGSCFQYLRAERLGPRASSDTSQDRVVRHRELGPSGEYTAHFLSVYGSDPVTHRTLLRQGVPSSLISQAEAWLGDISPGVQLTVTEHPEMDLVNLSFSFAVPGQVRSDPYRPTNVGFGLTYVLPVIVALLSARTGDLVIIENPEAHLHPRGQAQIGRMLALAAQAGVQVVVETHSDHVLNGIRISAKNLEIDAANVRINFYQRATVKDRNRSEILSPQLDQTGRIDRWPRGFFDEWENSLDSLLD